MVKIYDRSCFIAVTHTLEIVPATPDTFIDIVLVDLQYTGIYTIDKDFRH